MMWDRVLTAILAEFAVDAVLRPIFGDAMRLAGSSGYRVPLLELHLVADSENELWAPCVLQVSLFAKTMAELEAAERRVRRLLHTDLPVAHEGLGMWGSYLDGDFLPVPDRDTSYGRAIRFRLTPLRECYAGA